MKRRVGRRSRAPCSLGETTRSMAVAVTEELVMRLTRGAYRIRAAAGIGSACGLGASPIPDPRESARAAPTCTQIPPGCTPRLQWGSVVAWSSTAVTTGFVRGHRAPVTTNNRRRVHRDTHHRCTRMCKRPNLPPVFQVQSSLLKAPTTKLTGPVATPAPCGVICLLQPAWIK
jgi:hypothetical protein